MKIISRKEAKALGLTRYFTGKACKRSHISERQVSTANCCICRREIDRAYAKTHRAEARQRLREWVAKNPERYRKYSKKWRAANAERISECRKKLRATPKYIERDRATEKKWRAANAEKIRERQRMWHANHPDYQSEYQKKWRAAHPEHLEQARKKRHENPELEKQRRKRWRDKYPEYNKKWRAEHVDYLKEYYRKYHYEGPKKPTGETEWLRKNRVQLRNLRRHLRNRGRNNSEAPQS